MNRLLAQLPAGLRDFLFAETSRPTRPARQWLPGDLPAEVKRLGRDSESPPSTVEIENKWRSTSTLPLHVFMAYLYHNTSSTDQGLEAVPTDLSVYERHATDPAADGCNEASECQGAGSWPAYLKGPHSERRRARTKTIGSVLHRAVAFIHGPLNNFNKK